MRDKEAQPVEGFDAQRVLKIGARPARDGVAPTLGCQEVEAPGLLKREVVDGADKAVQGDNQREVFVFYRKRDTHARQMIASVRR